MSSTVRDSLRVCTLCKEPKPVTEFFRAPRRKDKLFPYCKKCNNEKGKAWRRDNPERVKELRERARLQRHPDFMKEFHLKYDYGLTREEYEQMLAEQHGKCCICRKKIKSKFSAKSVDRKIVACVDHDHSTGAVRSLVCNLCNYMIGCIEKHEHLVEDILVYLGRA